MAHLILDRETLRDGKYTRGYADMTPEQLEALLWLLGEWSIRYGGDHPRAVAAQDALLNFTRNPLTMAEVHELMRTARTQATTPTGTRSAE